MYCCVKIWFLFIIIIYYFLKNSYKNPTEPFVVDSNRNKEMILGSEGATQVDPSAIAV